MPMFDPTQYGAPPMPQRPQMPQAPAPPPMPVAPYGAQQQGYDMGPGGYNTSPQLTGRPMAPNPQLAATPPSANATGGPAAMQPVRQSVYDQLYKTGKQMAGQENLFAGFGPSPAVPVDPLAGMPPTTGLPGFPAPPPAGPQMPQLPPAPQPPTPDQYPIHLQAAMAARQPQHPRPIDRFPRAASLLGAQPQMTPPQARKRR